MTLLRVFEAFSLHKTTVIKCVDTCRCLYEQACVFDAQNVQNYANKNSCNDCFDRSFNHLDTWVL